jgi:hypothetical protein
MRYEEMSTEDLENLNTLLSTKRDMLMQEFEAGRLDGETVGRVRDEILVEQLAIVQVLESRRRDAERIVAQAYQAIGAVGVGSDEGFGILGGGR